MSTVPNNVATFPIASLKIDEQRGKYGMWLLIMTESFLFVDLFFSYFYIGNRTHRWLVELPPKLHYALPLLGILIFSSFVLELFGKGQLKKGNYGWARVGVVATVVLGLIFLALEGYAVRQQWSHLTYATNSYGSIFNTIITFHAAHVTVGILMLVYVLFLPLGPVDRSPYRALQTASLYWHFVDVVWVLVIVILYLPPNF